MTGLDHQLIAEARRYITGANVHMVQTWIFCYEESRPSTSGRSRYEKLLRDFVRTNLRVTIMTNQLEAQWQKALKLHASSTSINRSIGKFLTFTSD